MTALPDQQLSAETTRRVLNYLDVETAQPALGYLETLIARYVRCVPWESASRIVRRQNTDEIENCPRWPEIFWQSAIQDGTGGTCFESNLAFIALLRTLGFEGYLTINDMHEHTGVHTAIVILIDGQKWLVDAGFPVYAPLPLNPEQITTRETRLLNYTITPHGENHYDIERAPHPSAYSFTLIDQPISHADYCAATTRDYGENGLFLDKVIAAKVVNNQMWRFNSAEPPYHLQHFLDGQRVNTVIKGDAADAVFALFNIDAKIVRAALSALEAQP